MMKDLNELFPYAYRGGGYFRKKNVPVGESAEMLHGVQAIEFLYEQMIAAKGNELSQSKEAE